MKKIFATLALLMIANSAQALTLNKMEDDTVSASLIEGQTILHAKDGKVTAKLASVYRGGAAGMLSVVISLMDQSSTEGDYSHSVSYDLGSVDDVPQNISLTKVSEGQYSLKLRVKEVSMDDNGGFKYPVKNVNVKISLDSKGAVVKAQL